MKQEDKKLELRYLSMALPYRVKVCLYEKETCILTGIDGYEVYLDVDSDSFRIESIKPYLRPMSSMTKEEEKEFNEQMYNAKPYSDGKSYNVYEVIGLDINYLNAHHFDYFGLIEKGCAIRVTEDNNPYKIVEEQI